MSSHLISWVIDILISYSKKVNQNGKGSSEYFFWRFLFRYMTTVRLSLDMISFDISFWSRYLQDVYSFGRTTSWIMIHRISAFDSAKFGGPSWISGGRSGVSVRTRDCSDYRLDRIEGAAIADPETGSCPGNLLTAMHSGSSANCSSPENMINWNMESIFLHFEYDWINIGSDI
jgi:hypothetical protein